MLATVGRLKEALSLNEKLRTLEPLVSVYKLNAAIAAMESSGQYAAAIPILEAIPPDPALSFDRNVMLAHAYAAVGGYAKAADLLLAITGNQVTRQSLEDAARLIRTAPTKASAPEALPALERDLNFVYAYVGAPERILDQSERRFAIRGGGFDVNLWFPEYAPLRKTERFKTLVRKAGLVDYWRARGWPDLCRPMGADDFVCD